MIFSLFHAIMRWNKVEPNNGSFPFKITINDDEIRLGDKSYPMHEVTIKKLGGYDYRGKKVHGYIYFSRYAYKSNGTHNHLSITYKGEEYRLRFRVNNKKEANLIQDFKSRWGV